MADQETFSREELEGMSRLVLRRLCKARDMSSEDCSKMEFDDMVNWILEQQGDGGGGSKKAAPKGGSKKAAPKGGSKKAPPKAAPKGKKAPPKAAPKTETKDDDSAGEVSGDELANVVLEAIGELKERLDKVEEKIDTVGEVVDTNIGAIVEDIGELRADSYKVIELGMHFYRWARADGILTDDAAPEGLDFDDKSAAIDEECSGNEDGDE